MRNASVMKQTRLAFACAIALGAFSSAAIAQPSLENGVVTDLSGTPAMNSAGECWHSGSSPVPQSTRGCRPEARAQVPAPVAQAAAPAATAAVAPVAAAPVAWEHVAFDANVMFESGQSALRQSGRDTLDRFVDQLPGLDTQNIFAIGYADRMGTDAANQALSEQRVDAVRAYLVAKGIAPERLQTSAKGETRPTTYANECEDANNEKNVACMQPDRHVFIEVSGSRIAK